MYEEYVVCSNCGNRVFKVTYKCGYVVCVCPMCGVETYLGDEEDEVQD